MYIKQNQLRTAIDNAQEKCDLLNVQLSRVQIVKYTDVLRKMAENHKYQEGERISDEDFETIWDEIQGILEFTADKTIEMHQENSKEFEQGISSVDYMVAATDYLFALTMNHLGSPDMEVLFGADIQQVMGLSALNIQKEFVKYDMDTQKTYEKQRGQNAYDLRDSAVGMRIAALNIAENMIQVKTKDLAQLIADYQALQKRQEGHGAIWRFFHSTENKERNALLQDMEKALTKHLGDEYNLKTVIPASIADDFAEEHLLNYMEETVNARANDIEKVYGLKDDKKKNESEKEISDVRQALNDMERANLKEATDDKKKDVIEAPVQESTEKVVTQEVNHL